MSIFHAVSSGRRTQHHLLSALAAKTRVINAHGGTGRRFRHAHIRVAIQPFVTKMSHILTQRAFEAAERRSREHSSDHTDISAMATSWRHRCCSPSLCSHHLLPKLPNPVAERGSVDASFSGGQKVGSSLKRCLPEVKIRCVLAGSHSSRDICRSCLPARCVDLRGFTIGALQY